MKTKLILVIAMLPVIAIAQHKITDYTNATSLASNQLFLVTSSDALTNAHISYGQLTNSIRNGGGLTNLNATQLISGTVPDARLSANVFLKPLDIVTNNRTGDLTLANVTATSLTVPTLTVTTQNVGTLVLTNLDGSFWTNLTATNILGVLAATVIPALTGDVTNSAGTVATGLKATGSAGTYTKVTFDYAGRETSGTTLSSADIPDLSATYEAHVAILTNQVAATNVLGGVYGQVALRAVVNNGASGNDGNIVVLSNTVLTLSQNGGSITNISAANLSGTLANARLNGAYDTALIDATNIQSGGQLSATVMPALTGDVTTSAGSVSTTIAKPTGTFYGNTGGALIGANVTAYYAPDGNSATNISTSDLTTQTRNELSQAITSVTLYARTSAAVGSGKTDTITVFTNGVSTGIQVAITGTSQTTGNATGTINSLAAGNEIGLQINTQSASTPVKWSWSLKVK